MSVKAGTGPEHSRNTLRTPRNTPEHPPPPPDRLNLPGTPLITKVKLVLFDFDILSLIKKKNIFF